MRDVSEETGIQFRHTDGSGGNRYIVESVASGLALFDDDGDGNIDIYYLNGAPLRGTQFDKPPRNALYRNQGNWRFKDVTDKAGVGDTRFGLGLAVGDYDNDGDLDLDLNNFGPHECGHYQPIRLARRGTTIGPPLRPRCLAQVGRGRRSGGRGGRRG